MPEGSVTVRRRRSVAPRTVMIVASLGAFMAFVDTTIVTIAFPNMLESFPGASVGDLSWVLNAYNIALAAFLVPAGRFADLVGRRRMFAAGVVLFTFSSILCAAAPSVATLIAARALQGAGAAIILPASLGLILEAYPAARRNQAVALWSATGAVAAGIGPSLGGGLVVLSDWRLVFVINIPIGVTVWRLASARLVESRAPGRRALPDMAGAGLLAVAIATLTPRDHPIRRVGVGRLGDAGGVVLVGRRSRLVRRRCRVHPSPIVDLGLLASRRLGVPSVLTVVGGAGAFAIVAGERPVPDRGMGLLAADRRPRCDTDTVPGGDHGGRDRAPPRRPRSASQDRGRRRPVGRGAALPDRAILDRAPLPDGLPARPRRCWRSASPPPVR